MLKLYLYSKCDLRFKPLRGSRLAGVVVSLMLASSIVTAITSRLGVDIFGWKIFRVNKMGHENSILRSQLVGVNQELDHYEDLLNSLGRNDNLLRAESNLPALPSSEQSAAVGGIAINRDYGLPPQEDSLVADAVSNANVVDREERLEAQSLAGVRANQKADRILYEHVPAIEPVRGGIISSPFGIRFHPILREMLMHEGIDIEADAGTSVHATGDGEVSYVGRDGGYGLTVEIDNGFGYVTLFGHLSKALVNVGEKVRRGQVIALTGDSGLSTGPHLHYGVIKDGVFVNPELYFFVGPQFSSSKLYTQLMNK